MDLAWIMWGEARNVYNILMGKTLRKGHCGDPIRKWYHVLNARGEIGCQKKRWMECLETSGRFIATCRDK
jgi:hypothetical protein